jgi:hypothetical protein
MDREERTDQLRWQDLRDHALWWLRQGYRLSRLLTRAARRHPLLSLLSAGLVAAAFAGLLYLQSREYRVSTTLVYGELHPKIFGDMIARLDALIEQEEIEKSARLLALSPAEVRKIEQIEVSDIRGKPLSTNYTMRKEPMRITLTLSDPIPEDSLYRAVTYYLNSNPFTADRLEMKKRQLREELAYIETKIGTIDSILTNLYAARSAAQSVPGGITIENAEGKNAYELLNLSRELLRRKMAIQNDLINPENVFAIDNFLLFPRARWTPGNVLNRVLAGAAVGYLLLTIVVLWRDFLKKLVAEA